VAHLGKDLQAVAAVLVPVLEVAEVLAPLVQITPLRAAVVQEHQIQLLGRRSHTLLEET
jgi:hypothetical protein